MGIEGDEGDGCRGPWISYPHHPRASPYLFFLQPVVKIQSWRDTGALKLHAGAKRTEGTDKTCR